MLIHSAVAQIWLFAFNLRVTLEIDNEYLNHAYGIETEMLLVESGIPLSLML